MIPTIEVKNQPIRLPGLKPGVCSGLILSGAFNPSLKIGVWRHRTYQLERLKKDRGLEKRYNAVKKSVYFLSENPRHKSFKAHEFTPTPLTPLITHFS
jgi:hypothetical protein